MLSVALLSSSDKDEEYSVSELIVMRRQLRQQSNIFSLPNRKFISYFRLSKDAFKYVLDTINPHLEGPKRRNSIPNILKLAATMRILAEGSYQKGAGNNININLSQTSVSKVFKQCIDVMYDELCPRWINFDMNDKEMNEMKDYFYKKTGFPGVIGCIDGTHIKICAPEIKTEFSHYNNKGFISLNTAVVCDHKQRIRWISCHNPGSWDDSFVWHSSDLKQFIMYRYDNDENNTWLLGDADYTLEPYLITPFLSAEEGSPESRFNHAHEKVRNVVGQTIGVLKNRFRCISGARQLNYSPEFAGKIIAVCAALHNICIHYKLEWPEINLENDLMESSLIDDENEDLSGLYARLTIMKEFFN